MFTTIRPRERGMGCVRMCLRVSVCLTGVGWWRDDCEVPLEYLIGDAQICSAQVDV